MILALLEILFSNIFLVGFVSGGSSFPAALTADEEAKYLEQYQSGSDEAKNILIEHNLRLVAHVVKKYQGCGIESDDLISIGTIGLIKAVSTYNTEKKIRLATYASKCIENEVLMVLRSQKKLSYEVSLSEPIGYDKEGNEVSLIDVLQTDEDDTADKIERDNNIAKLYKIFSKVLRGREAQVIKKRYGLYGTENKTQREIADELGISRSYVSRLEKKAVKKLAERFSGT